ncbi:MAG: hypothetical protein ACKVW3_16740 [Phycisphaerales bacterium]
MANVSMRRSATVILAACGGLCGAARSQELMTYSMTWHEVMAGTNQPVATPNGVIEPGEGVRIALKVLITPGIGSTAIYTPPPPPGTGTIAGLGSIFIDILATNFMGGAWSNITRNAAANPGGTPGGHNWTLGGSGSLEGDGNLRAIGAGQFVLPGGTAVSHNPVENIYRATWTPTNYSIRNVAITPAGAAAGGGHHSSILVHYGVTGAGEAQYVGKFVLGSFSGTGPIPVVPAPGLAGLLYAAAISASRRRRVASKDMKR